MSGLIFAGLGKGISDAGATFGNAMMRDYEMTRQDALAALREERLGKREEAREVRAEDRKEAAAQKDATIYAAAEVASVGIGETRRFEKFKKDLGETEMPEEDLRKVFDQQYDQRKVGAFEGADRYAERYSKQKEDVLNEIRRTGGSSGLIAQAQASYKTAQETERASDRLAFDERKADAQEDRRSKEFAALMPIRQQAVDASTTRAARPVGGTSGGESLDLRGLQTEATAASRAVSDARKSRDKQQDVVKNSYGSEKATAQAALAEANGRLDAAVNYASQVNQKISAFNTRRSGGAETPADNSSKPSAPGVTKNYSNLWK